MSSLWYWGSASQMKLLSVEAGTTSYLSNRKWVVTRNHVQHWHVSTVGCQYRRWFCVIWTGSGTEELELFKVYNAEDKSPSTLSFLHSLDALHSQNTETSKTPRYLRFNGHFPGGPGLHRTRMSPTFYSPMHFLSPNQQFQSSEGKTTSNTSA